MASKFIPWISDSNVETSTINSQASLEEKSTLGFSAGTKAIAKDVNSALRATSLITSGFMNAILPNSTLDFTSSLSDVVNAILTGLAGITVTNAVNSTNSTNSTYATKIGNSSTHPSVGGADQLVYINSNGELVQGNFVPKLNGNSLNVGTSSFYAPTSVGNNNQILKSNGSGAPTWVNQSSITAGKADKLTTARTIGGVSFDGSANINLPGVNTAGNQNTSGNAATVTNGVYTTNFNTSSQTKFGDYIVEKKKLLYSSDSEGQSFFDFGRNMEGKILEVEVKFNASKVQSYFYKFRVPGMKTLNFLGKITHNSTYNSDIYEKFYFTFSGTTYADSVLLTADMTTIGGSVLEPYSPIFLKIYEIIE